MNNGTGEGAAPKQRNRAGAYPQLEQVWLKVPGHQRTIGMYWGKRNPHTLYMARGDVGAVLHASSLEGVQSEITGVVPSKENRDKSLMRGLNAWFHTKTGGGNSAQHTKRIPSYAIPTQRMFEWWHEAQAISASNKYWVKLGWTKEATKYLVALCQYMEENREDLQRMWLQDWWRDQNHEIPVHVLASDLRTRELVIPLREDPDEERHAEANINEDRAATTFTVNIWEREVRAWREGTQLLFNRKDLGLKHEEGAPPVTLRELGSRVLHEEGAQSLFALIEPVILRALAASDAQARYPRVTPAQVQNLRELADALEWQRRGMPADAEIPARATSESAH